MPQAPMRGFSITTLKGGRNGIDPPTLVPDDQCLEAVNVDWLTGAIGRKRPGCDTVSLTTSARPVSGPIDALFRHLPAGSDETQAQLWLVDDAKQFHAFIASATLGDITVKDAMTGDARGTRGVVFNGKLFLLYPNAAGRVQVYDGVVANTLRRAGLAAPSGAPTAVVSSGAVTDTRTYESAVVVKSAGVVIRRSELSAASTTTALASQQAVLTLVGAPGEGETHWELYGASTDGVYKFVADGAIGTTITDNNTLLTGALAPLVGTNSVFPDAVLAAVDGSRLLFARHRTNTALTSRIWFSPPFALAGDDERNPTILTQNFYLDISANDGDFITALNGPLYGSMYAWKNHQIWKLGATGDVTAPYTASVYSKTIGSIFDKSTILATDEHGQAAIYFISTQGPYRIGAQGLQYMGRDIEDIWPTINLQAVIPSHGVFHPKIHQLWWWLTTGTATDPNVLFVFDTILGHALLYPVGDSPPTAGVRRGWAKWTGDLASCRCSVMFGRTIGATMGIEQRPYAGLTAAPKLLAADSATMFDDGGTKYQSYVLTKAYRPAGKLTHFDIGNPILQAKASAGTVVELQMIPDWGAQPTTKDYVTLTAVNNETRVIRKFEKAKYGKVKTLQFQIGDPVAQNTGGWELDAFDASITPGDPIP